MVAIPTGIISAGFVEQYDRAKMGKDVAIEEDIHFISIRLNEEDFWTGKCISEIGLPGDSIIAFIRRNGSVIIPNGQTMLLSGDICVLGGLNDDASEIDLKEVSLGRNHRWIGNKIKDLDISRQSYIVMLKRDNRNIEPYGKLKLMENDKLLIYTKIRKSSQSDGENHT
mgnify:CR=1 FL=1